MKIETSTITQPVNSATKPGLARSDSEDFLGPLPGVVKPGKPLSPGRCWSAPLMLGRGGLYLRSTPEQYGKLGRPPGRKQYAQRAITPKGDIRVSKYRFIFSVGDKPDLQGYVDFPEGEVPHFPQTNNEVNCASNYGREIKGVVQDISFHYVRRNQVASLETTWLS
jgi:hypothetical protein